METDKHNKKSIFKFLNKKKQQTKFEHNFETFHVTTPIRCFMCNDMIWVRLLVLFSLPKFNLKI